MKHLKLLLLLFVFSGLNAQNPDGTKFSPDSKEYKEYYTTLLDMYKKMYDSELGLKAYDAKNNFMTKASFDTTLQEEKYQSLGGEGAMLAWIEDNFEKTKFKSIEEARELFSIERELYKQLRYANIDLYKYYSQAKIMCDDGLLEEVYHKLILLYGRQRFMF